MTKILIVDDEPDVLDLMQQRFRRRIRSGEFDLVFAHNGVEALERIADTPDIDIVLTDIRRPQMDGLALLDQIRDAKPMLKAVVVSAFGDMENIRTAMNRGAFDFVTKPIDFTDLDVTLAKTIDHLTMLRDAVGARDRLVALQRELDVAASIQTALLPKEPPKAGAVAMHGLMTPAKDVGGDFYDFFDLGGGKTGFAVGDVSGKGMPAALFMAVSRTLLRATASAGLSPGPCLARVNELLCRDNDACMFVTLAFGVLDEATGRIALANGGHCPPIRFGDAGAERVTVGAGVALGVIPDLSYEETVIELAPGEGLVLYSDGVTEAEDAAEKPFGEEGLLAVLRNEHEPEPNATVDRIADAVHGHLADGAPQDDLTCLALVYRGAGGSDAKTMVTLPADLNSVDALADAVARFGSERGWPKAFLARVTLVLEELVVNTISHGELAGSESSIRITLLQENGHVVIDYVDRGPPFDPTNWPEPDVDAPLEARPLGGLGVHLVNRLMDDIAYAREDDENRVRLSIAIPGST